MTKHEEAAPGESPRPFWRRRKTWVIIGICLGFAQFVNWCARVPLPSDEEMIAHFQAHRAEFEELVRLHRTFAERENPPELTWPREEQGTQELFRRAGVSAVDYVPVSWLPDPYTLATARRVQEMKDSCAQDWKQWNLGGNSCLGVGREAKTQDERQQLAMECLKARQPAPKCRLHGYQYGELNFKPEPLNTYWKGTWRLVTVWKTYLHFPEPPRIEGGYLLGPMRTDGTCIYDGTHTYDKKKLRVLSSLNYYPFNWKWDECVYRSIDAHWFISLCNH